MNRTAPIRTLVISLVVLALAGSVEARKRRPAKKGRTVRALVLPLKAKGLQPERARELGKHLGVTMVRELRELGVFRVLVGRRVSKRLHRLKRKNVLVKDCDDKPRCVRRVGRAMRAKVLFHTQLAKAAEGVTVTVRTLDTRSGKEIRKAVEHTSGELDDVARAARWAARKVSSPMITTLRRGKGRLEIRSQEKGADLVLNGKNFGKRTNKSFKVGAGVFDVRVEKQGFEPFHDVVVVLPGQKKVVEAELEAEQPSPPVVAAGAQGDRPDAAAGPDEPEKPKKELPAWAKFEKKTEKKPEKKPGERSAAAAGAGDEDDAGATAAAAGGTGASGTGAPYLPGERDGAPLDQPVEKLEDDETAWYQTWWFWTVVGVAVAGGVGGGLYAGGVFDSGGGTGPTGAAAISWQ